MSFVFSVRLLSWRSKWSKNETGFWLLHHRWCTDRQCIESFFFYLFLLPLGIVQRGFGKDKKKSERVKIRLTRDNKWQIPSATFVLRLSPCLRIQCSRLGRAGLPVGHFSAVSLPSSYNLKSFFKNHFVLSHGNAGKNDLWWFCRRWRRFRVNSRRILKMWVRVCVFVDVLVLLKLRSSERNGFTIFNVHFALL